MKSQSKSLKKILKNYFIVFLLAPLILKIFFYIFSDWTFTYDETLVLDISTQGYAMMLDTILAEPHPPGFYILISFVTKLTNPFSYPLTIKIIFVIFNFVLWTCGLYYGIRKKIINKNTIYFFALLFSMYSVVRINTEIKQDLASFPILFIFIFALISYLKKKQNKLDILIIYLFPIALLFLGYINYAISIVVLIVFLFLNNFSKHLKKSLLLSSAVSFIYFYTFGLKQILLNSTRFGWFDEYRANVVMSTIKLVTNSNFPKEVIFLQMFIYVVIIFSGWIFLHREYRKLSMLYLLTLLILLVIFSINRTFITVRYSLIFHLLTTFLGSITLFKLSKIHQYIPTLILVVFFLFPSYFSYFKSLNAFFYTDKIISEGIADTTDPIGLLTQHSIISYGAQIRLNIISDKEIVPLSKELRNYYYSNHISKEILSADTIESVLTLEEISSWLTTLDINNYIYVLDDRELGSTYDVKNIVYTSLLSSCKISEDLIIRDNLKIVLFEECFL